MFLSCKCSDALKMYNAVSYSFTDSSHNESKTNSKIVLLLEKQVFHNVLGIIAIIVLIFLLTMRQSS